MGSGATSAKAKSARTYIATPEVSQGDGMEGSKQIAYRQWSGIAPQRFGTIPAPSK
jgi:hypothetical protein